MDILGLMYMFFLLLQIHQRVERCHFLAFTSGANRPSAVGFEITPSIMFTDDERLPFVSTCAISLTLPRHLQTYDAFKEALHLAVLGSHGCGNV